MKRRWTTRTVALTALVVLGGWGGALACKSAPPDAVPKERPAEGAAAERAAQSAPSGEPERPAGPPNPAPVRSIVVHDVTPAPARLADLGKRPQAIGERLIGESQRFTRVEGAAADGAYELGFAVAHVLMAGDEVLTEPAAGSLLVTVGIQMGRRSGGLSELYETEAHHLLPWEPQRDGALDAVVLAEFERLAAQARGRLEAQLALAGADDAGVIAMLRDDDAFVRADAAREAGERKLKGAVSALELLLGAESAEVRGAALGALGRIADRGSATAVAALTRGMDHEEVLRAVLALGDIGGPEARRYLKSIAESHPVAEIQAAARYALESAQ